MKKIRPDHAATVAAAASVAFAASTTLAAPFFDNFDSGSLDAWAPPVVQGNVTNPSVSAATGSLRMRGVSSASSPGFIALPLASSTADASLYQDGTVGFDVDIDDRSQAVFGARVSFATESSVQFAVINRPSGALDQFGIFIAVNNSFVASSTADLLFDAASLRIDASWIGDQLALTITDRVSLETQSISLTDASLLSGGEVGLGVYNSSATTSSLGATFDNFSIVPAPGGVALLSVGCLVASRRRRPSHT